MSSHHIIRDDQEPALLIKYLDNHLLGNMLQLLGWAPTVVVSEDALGNYLSLGHKLDIALVSGRHADFWKEQMEYQGPVQVEAVPERGSIKSGLEALLAKGHRAVNVVLNEEDLLQVVPELIPFLDQFNIVIYTQNQRHILSKTVAFRKWLPAYSSLSLLPLCENSVASTKGFDLNLDHDLLGEGIELTKKMEGDVSITINQVPYMVSESLN